MPARRNSTPSYLRHQQSGRARAVWTDATGERHQKLLPGPFDSAESRAAFGRLQVELASSPLAQPAEAGPEAVTVAELLLAHLDHAERHYRRADGSHTPELAEYKALYRLLRELYATLPACEFTPLRLKAARQVMLAKGWCRPLINQRIGRVKRIFKWGVGEELVPVATSQALTAVSGLQRGRTAARETEPVRPVEPWVVRATTPHVLPTVAAMIEVQSLTGMRPGEVCTMRPRDLDTTGETWTYRVEQHKTAWRGKDRTVTVGPRA